MSATLTPAATTPEFATPEPVLTGLSIDDLILLADTIEDLDLARMPQALRTQFARISRVLNQASRDAIAEAATPISPAGCTYVVTGADGYCEGRDTVGGMLSLVLAETSAGPTEVTVSRQHAWPQGQ